MLNTDSQILSLKYTLEQSIQTPLKCVTKKTRKKDESINKAYFPGLEFFNSLKGSLFFKKKKDQSLDYLLGSICLINVNYQKQPLKIPGFS